MRKSSIQLGRIAISSYAECHLPVRNRFLRRIKKINLDFWKLHSYQPDPSLEKAMEWYHSEDYQRIKKYREGAATGTLIAIEGVKQDEEHQEAAG
jgi:hypothetical protein